MEMLAHCLGLGPLSLSIKGGNPLQASSGMIASLHQPKQQHAWQVRSARGAPPQLPIPRIMKRRRHLVSSSCGPWSTYDTPMCSQSTHPFHAQNRLKATE
eukprot:scaffold78311_cov33-Tisochrysis_lutea.AAC.2